MNGGFIFSSQTRAVFSLTFTFQVYGASRKTNLAMFPSTGNDDEMSVEFEGKQKHLIECFNVQLPVNQRGLKPHTDENRKS